MKTSRYSDGQILSILRQADGGVPVAELCREHGLVLRVQRVHDHLWDDHEVRDVPSELYLRVSSPCSTPNAPCTTPSQNARAG